MLLKGLAEKVGCLVLFRPCHTEWESLVHDWKNAARIGHKILASLFQVLIFDQSFYHEIGHIYKLEINEFNIFMYFATSLLDGRFLVLWLNHYTTVDHTSILLTLIFSAGTVMFNMSPGDKSLSLVRQCDSVQRFIPHLSLRWELNQDLLVLVLKGDEIMNRQNWLIFRTLIILN